MAGIDAEFVEYRRAVSAATWSLPSHASLFTGQYPWTHGCHNLAGLRLNPAVPTIAQRLRTAGYATAAFSSNSVLSPGTGLLRGFEVAAWGRWSENIFRLSSEEPPHRFDARDGQPAPSATGPRRFSSAIAATLRHVPLLGFVVSRVVGQPTGGPGASMPLVSPWIEPEFERWIASVPSDRPSFGVVNLMDLHEPYAPEWNAGDGRPTPMRFSLIPQDGRSYSAGPERPPTDWVERMNQLYGEAYAGVGRRIRRLWSAHRRSRGDRPTMFIVTSDHGQSLGEGGWFFHSHGQPRDELTRIPLAVHYPDRTIQDAAVERADRWVSLVDLAPTIAEVAGVMRWSPLDGASLLDLDAAAPDPAVLVAGDGPIARPSRLEPGGIMSERSATCVAFVGDTKLVVSARGHSVVDVRRYSVGTPGAVTPTDTGRELRVTAAARRASSAVLSMLSATTGENSPEVSERLLSWGYG